MVPGPLLRGIHSSDPQVTPVIAPTLQMGMLSHVTAAPLLQGGIGVLERSETGFLGMAEPGFVKEPGCTL